jgi:hypothetical protein
MAVELRPVPRRCRGLTDGEVVEDRHPTLADHVGRRLPEARPPANRAGDVEPGPSQRPPPQVPAPAGLNPHDAGGFLPNSIS